MQRQSTVMMWKVWAVPVAEFVGGLVALRVGLPLESMVITAAGLGLTLLGLSGLTRPMAKPRSRPYP